jgi:CubicO group peptidase (beta-lactamase class C family)
MLRSLRKAAVSASGLLALSIAMKAAGPNPSVAPMTALLSPMVGIHLAGAVVAVASRDRILDLEAVGYADLQSKKPMTPDALFWIASESKAITAAALMVLVDEGKVSVDAPVETYLPEFRNLQVKVGEKDGQPVLEPASHPILVREILSHTSGLGFSSPVEVPTLDVGTLESRVSSYPRQPLNFQPSTKYLYSNEGLNTAGRIIEVVSGMPYEAFLAKRLFGPLGMTDTTFFPSRSQLSRLATSYKESDDKKALVAVPIDQLKYPLDGPGRYPMPAGGLFSTAHDEIRFCQMLLNGGELGGVRCLSPASARQMTTRQTAAAVDFDYGFGWGISEAGYYHTGAYGTNALVEPGLDMVVVYMVHQAHGKYPNTEQNLADLVNEAGRVLVRPRAP